MSVQFFNTFGASEGLHVYLEVVSDVQTVVAPNVRLSAGQTAKAYTEGILADDGDRYGVSDGERCRARFVLNAHLLQLQPPSRQHESHLL